MIYRNEYKQAKDVQAMDYGKNTDKYIKTILDKSHEIVLNPINWQKKGKIQHSKEAVFVAKTLFEPLSEIMTSIEIIDLIPTFIRTFPYKRSGMSKVKYLQYHIGNYFVEIGNLNYRLTGYRSKIKNAYGKTTKNKKSIELINEKLKKSIRTIPNDPIGIRDMHVHNFRYTDKELDRLLELELFAKYAYKSKDGILFESQYVDQFKKVRNKWKKIIKEKSVIIEQLLELYFEILTKIVMPKGRIIYPFNNEKS